MAEIPLTPTSLPLLLFTLIAYLALGFDTSLTARKADLTGEK